MLEGKTTAEERYIKGAVKDALVLRILRNLKLKQMSQGLSKFLAGFKMRT